MLHGQSLKLELRIHSCKCLLRSPTHCRRQIALGRFENYILNLHDAHLMSEPEDPSTQVSLRPVIRPDDDGFLEELYFSVRDDLGGAVADEQQMRQLLKIQFRAQSLTYERDFPDATHNIILVDGRRVGRMIVERRADAIQLVDIALLPTARNLGIGTQLIRGLIAECKESRRPLLLRVIKASRAVTLYERLGFRRTGEDDGVRISMRWEQDDRREP